MCCVGRGGVGEVGSVGGWEGWWEWGRWMYACIYIWVRERDRQTKSDYAFNKRKVAEVVGRHRPTSFYGHHTCTPVCAHTSSSMNSYITARAAACLGAFSKKALRTRLRSRS